MSEKVKKVVAGCGNVSFDRCTSTCKELTFLYAKLHFQDLRMRWQLGLGGESQRQNVCQGVEALSTVKF